MKSLFYILLLAIVFGALGVATPSILKFVERQSLPVTGTAPIAELKAINLINSENLSFNSELLNGKVWVFGTFFTSCPVTCPTLLTDLKDAIQKFVTNNDFVSISVSVDPTYDSPEVIKQFISKRNFNLPNWHFLTGAQADVQTLVVDGFKIGTREEPLLHSNRIMLIDKNGNIRGSYLGTDPTEFAKLAADIQKLL